MDISPENANTLWFLLILLGLGAALTWYVAHWRELDEHAKQSEAIDPGRVDGEIDDDWRGSDWELTLR